MSIKVNNDIEKILSQGAENYEVNPPDKVWQNIKKEKNSRYIFFLKYYKWRIASLIALLAMVSTGLYYTINTEDNYKISTSDIDGSSQTIETPNIATPKDTEDTEITSKNQENKIDNENKNLNSQKNNEGQIQNKSSNSKYSNDISLNEDENNSKNIEETPINTNKYDVSEIKSKLFLMFKYSTYPIFEEYKPVIKKTNKTYTKNKEKESEKKLKKGTYSLEFGGGPSYIYRNLSGGNYLLRNESEKPMISFQTNFKVNYHINNTFSFQSGLLVETRNEKLNYYHTELKKKLIETPRNVTIFHPILPPKTITVIDTSYNNEEVNYNFENINKYTSFNIPLLIGYNFGNSKQQFRISAGTLLNIYSSNNAKILEIKGNETVLTTYKEPAKINPSVYSAVAFNKVINNYYSLVFELSYYSNISNRLGNESPTIQRNSGFNFTSAIRYNIITR